MKCLIFLCACLSVTFVHCAQTAGDIDTISFAHDSAVTLPDRIKMGLTSVNPSSPNSQILLPVFSRPTGYKYSMLAHYWFTGLLIRLRTKTLDVYPLLMEMRRMIIVPTRDGISLNCGTDLWCLPAHMSSWVAATDTSLLNTHAGELQRRRVAALQLLLSWHHYA